MNNRRVGVGVSLGLCFGAALGAAFQNLPVGISFGVALATALGLVFSSSSTEQGRTKLASDKPPTHPLDLGN